MLILPLGFGKKFFKSPWMTVLLVVTTSSLCIFIWQETKSSQVVFGEAFFESKLHLKTQDALEQYCNHIFSTNPHCRTSAQLAYNTIVENLGPEDLKTNVLNNKDSKVPRELRILSRELIADHLDILQSSRPDDWRHFQKILAVKHRENYIFSGLNKRFDALIMAHFSHQGVIHLAGNMILLLLIGMIIEQRMSRIRMAVVYFASSLIALYLYQKSNASSDFTALMGASAGVSSFFGLATVLFFKYRMAFNFYILLVVYPIKLNRNRIFISLGLALTTLYLIQDLAGFLGIGGGVAFGAHLVGWICGFLVALDWKNTDPIEFPFISKDEMTLSQHLQENSCESLDNLEIAHYILERNRENLIAKKTILLHAYRNHLVISHKDWTTEALTLEYLSVCLREMRIHDLRDFFSSLPLNVCLPTSLSKLSHLHLAKLSEILCESRHLTSLIFLFAHLERDIHAFKKLQSLNPLKVPRRFQLSEFDVQILLNLASKTEFGLQTKTLIKEILNRSDTNTYERVA